MTWKRCIVYIIQRSTVIWDRMDVSCVFQRELCIHKKWSVNSIKAFRNKLPFHCVQFLHLVESKLATPLWFLEGPNWEEFLWHISFRRVQRSLSGTFQTSFWFFSSKTTQDRPNGPSRHWGQYGLWFSFGSFYLTVQKLDQNLKRVSIFFDLKNFN